MSTVNNQNNNVNSFEKKWEDLELKCRENLTLPDSTLQLIKQVSQRIYSLGAQDMAKRVDRDVIGPDSDPYYTLPGMKRPKEPNELIENDNLLRKIQRTKLKQILEEM